MRRFTFLIAVPPAPFLAYCTGPICWMGLWSFQRWVRSCNTLTLQTWPQWGVRAPGVLNKRRHWNQTFTEACLPLIRTTATFISFQIQWRGGQRSWSWREGTFSKACSSIVIHWFHPAALIYLSFIHPGRGVSPWSIILRGLILWHRDDNALARVYKPNQVSSVLLMEAPQRSKATLHDSCPYSVTELCWPTSLGWRSTARLKFRQGGKLSVI